MAGRFELVRSDGDGPAHVYVFGDGQAKVNLAGSGGAPRLVWAVDMKRNDVRRARLIVDLTNGCTFAFPPRLAQGLESATSDELSNVRILRAGYGLHW